GGVGEFKLALRLHEASHHSGRNRPRAAIQSLAQYLGHDIAISRPGTSYRVCIDEQVTHEKRIRLDDDLLCPVVPLLVAHTGKVAIEAGISERPLGHRLILPP